MILLIGLSHHIQRGQDKGLKLASQTSRWLEDCEVPEGPPSVTNVPFNAPLRCTFQRS